MDYSKHYRKDTEQDKDQIIEWQEKRIRALEQINNNVLAELSSAKKTIVNLKKEIKKLEDQLFDNERN